MKINVPQEEESKKNSLVVILADTLQHNKTDLEVNVLNLVEKLTIDRDDVRPGTLIAQKENSKTNARKDKNAQPTEQNGSNERALEPRLQ